MSSSGSRDSDDEYDEDNETNGKLLKSPVWKIWNWILDEDDGIISGKIACIHCNTVRDYEGSSEGTTNLQRHEEKCVKILKKNRFLCCRTMK